MRRRNRPRRDRRDRRPHPRRGLANRARSALARAARRAPRGTSGASACRPPRTSPSTTASGTWSAVVFGVDSESVTGAPPIPNEEIAEIAAANPDVLIPFASIDPARGADGVRAARRLIDEHGVRGFKFHPNSQGFFPNDPAAYPLYEVIEAAGLPALFHTGHSGIGAGVRGGGGIRLKYSNPMDGRRRRGRLPRPEDRPRPPVVPVAGRGDLGRAPQAERLHRPLGLVAEVLPGDPRPLREHACCARRCSSAPTSP